MIFEKTRLSLIKVQATKFIELKEQKHYMYSSCKCKHSN